MKKKKIKLCLTKQLLNMFKLWCEWGIIWFRCSRNIVARLKNTSNWGENTYVLLCWSTPRERGTPSMIRAYKRAWLIVFSSEFWKPLPEIKE